MILVASQFVSIDIAQFSKAVIGPIVAEAVQEACELVQTIAKGYCPVDTGALQDSIVVDPQVEGDSSVTGSVSANMPYASYVEYGTGQRGDPSAPYSHVETWPGQPAQPYMRPSLDENREPINSIFFDKLSAGMGG